MKKTCYIINRCERNIYVEITSNLLRLQEQHMVGLADEDKGLMGMAPIYSDLNKAFDKYGKDITWTTVIVDVPETKHPKKKKTNKKRL